MTDLRTRRLLALFVIVSVLGVGYVAVRYLGADRLVGLGPYTVHAELVRSGGLVPHASVTYRGVEVGTVGDMQLTPGGIDVELRIRHDAPSVPTSALAVVSNRSAVGEQYVDLQPPNADGPYLDDGSVIPVAQTRTPVPVDRLLGHVNALATSVPTPQLRTTVDELDTAFDRTGPSLARLLDSSNLLVGDALRNLPQTTALLRDGRTVLDTQSELGPQLGSFGRDLRRVGDQLRADDPNLRRLAAAAPPAALELDGLMRDVAPDLGPTLHNLLTVDDVVGTRLPGVQQLLVTYPQLAAEASSVLPGDGRVHLGLVLGDDPPSCRNGYLQPNAGWRPATAQDIAPAATDARCNTPPPVDPRGAQNSPAPNGLPGGYRAGIGAGATATGSATGPGASPASRSPGATAQNPLTASALAAVPATGILRASRSGAPPIVIAGLTGP